jgi:hypothetical protein
MHGIRQPRALKVRSLPLRSARSARQISRNRSGVWSRGAATHDALALLLFQFEIDLLYGAPLWRLLARLETWPVDYVAAIKA